MTRVWLVILFGAATAVSCNDPDVLPLTQLNLDRPVDISFACFGPLKDVGDSAQPPAWCNAYSPVLANEQVIKAPPGFDVPAFDPNSQPPFTWYGFILQSASGTVALSRWEAKPSDQFATGLSTNPAADVQVRDADPRTPGRNAISVGDDPIAIGTDVAGCHEITANAGSCDLSVVDINSAVAYDRLQTFPVPDNTVSRPVIVDRLTVRNGAMDTIRARPAAMVMQPSAPAVVVPNACQATASGLAYVAYPGCNLVAGVDLATGVIKQAIKFTGSVPAVLSAAELMTLSCADECSGAALSPALPTVRPSALDLRVDPRSQRTRLAIGADNMSVLTVVDLDPDFAPLPAPMQVQLEDTTAGHTLAITSLALSPQIAMGNSTSGKRRNNNVTVFVKPLPDPPAPPVVDSEADAIGASPGGEGQYVYAVATDGTVRVADVLGGKECDTQIDLRFVRNIAADPANIPRLQCLPIGDPSTPRRPGARGPGIELPAAGAPASVTFIQGLDRPAIPAPTETVPNPGENPPAPNVLIGYFAIITASSGQSYVVNVDDDDGPDVFVKSTAELTLQTSSQKTAPVLLMAHQLRDGIATRGAVADPNANACLANAPGTPSSGGPRSTTAPVSHVAANTLSVDPAQANKGLVLPNIQRAVCTGTDATDPANPVSSTVTVSELQFGATWDVRDQVYPDLRATTNDAWTLTWEGNLSNDSLLSNVDGPSIRSAQMRVDNMGLHLIDHSAPFCDTGVEPFDIVQLRGCNPINGDNECPSGYTCYTHPDNQVTGLGACMLTSEASRLKDACRDFLTTARRYTVARAESGELALFPRKHVLSTTPVDGCVDNNQCQNLADYALGLRSPKQPGDATSSDPHTWQCVVDPQRAPVNGDPAAKRCVETCAITADCEAGTICIGASPDGVTRDGTCMESVLPPQSCVNGPQKFELHASEAFTMIGTQRGLVHTVVEQGGQCVSVKTPGSLQISRIPLTAAACDPAADPFTGALPGGGFEPNPCSTEVVQAETQPNYLDVSKDCTVSELAPTIVTTRATPAPAIKVRTPTMTLTLVDPYSPGDARCVGDRQGALGKIPQMLPALFDSATPFVPTYQLTFDQTAGFTALAVAPLAVTPVFPVKVVRGPSESIWIMDNGDLLQVGQASTKGQVYRVEMLNLGTVNQLQ